jgi:predicted metal-dependent phosphoesterase TrpH
MIKVDLHTHSIGSRDGGIRIEQYAQAIEDGLLDYIAVTDHNAVKIAQQLHASMGEHIIIGQEIMSGQGELIGLFTPKLIRPNQSALATAKAIHEQGGLVYVPHPFETVRSGLDETALNIIVNEVDIVEVHNGRALFQNRGPKAATWARLHGKAMAASSDAHGKKGLGTTYTLLSDAPSAATPAHPTLS